MKIREASSDDGPAVREVAEQSFTQSYALSPEQIEILLEEEFGDDAFAGLGEGVERTLLVAEDDGELLGFVAYKTDGDEGTVHWLHVEPTVRDQDVGSRLFEAARDAFEDSGVTDVRALTLEENPEGRGFFEVFDFVRDGQHHREVGGERFAEYVYVPAEQASDDGSSGATGADTEGSKPTDEDAAADVSEEMKVPETVTTDDGETVYVAGDDAIAGESGPFFVVYTDEAHDQKYGYYCTNCESLATAGDTTGRIECGTCGNTHEPDENYDAGYL